MNWNSKNKVVLLILLFILSVFFYLAGINNTLPFNEDSSIYINLAKSIAKGNGLLYTVGPQDAQCNYYPLVYPLFLSLPVYIFPGNYLVLKLLSFFFTIALIVAGAYFLPKFFQEKTAAWATIVLFVLNPQISFYSRQILTEMPYTLFSVMSIYFLIRYRETEKTFNMYFFVSLVSIAFAFYVRLIGFSLSLSVLIFFLLYREYKKAAASLIFFLVMAPWVLNNLILGRSAYANEFVYRTNGLLDFSRRWLYNLAATVGKEFSDLFFYPWLSHIDPRSFEFIFKFSLGLILAILMLWGFILKLKKEGLKVWDSYVFIYFFFIYLSWTHHGARYLVPILFFLTYYLILAIKSILSPKAFYPLIVALAFISIFGNVRLIQEEAKPLKPEEVSLIKAVDWLKANAPGNSIIISRKNNWVYEYAGFRGLKFFRISDIKKQYRFIKDLKANYVIVDQCKIYRDTSRDYLLPMVDTYKDSFEKTYETKELPVTVIYKVKG